MDIEDISSEQRGVITRAQAMRAGLTADEVKHRLRSGRWQRISPGTYATFTGTPPRAALRWAGVLQAGAGAVLSYESAAEEIGLLGPGRGDIHVTVPAARRINAPPGIVVHRCRNIGARRHSRRSPPQTRVEETVLDLCAGATTEEAMGWIAAACGGRFTTPDRIARAMLGRRRMPGRAELTDLLGDIATGCGSVLEWRYLRDVERAHSLPPPVRQWCRPRDGGSWYDDLYYPDLRVRIELDGRAAHPEQARWRDFRRDNAAAQVGDVVLRYGAADVYRQPCLVAVQVASVLQRAGWRGVAAPCGGACATLRDL